MAYEASGLIEATDYNTRATDVNAIWGQGSGANGYGQSTTLTEVSAAATVAATNWASIISRIDSLRNHQSGVASGITQPTASDTITFLTTLDTRISGIVTNKLVTNTRGTASPTGLGNPAISNATSWVTSATKEFSITFSSTNTVRYYFNSGGLLTFYLDIISPGTDKATDWDNFLANQVGTITIGSNFCSRTGTGGDNLTQNTGVGFHDLTATYQTLFAIGSTSATADYGANSITIQAKVGGALYGASSNIVSLRAVLTDAAADGTNDQVVGNLHLYSGFVPPETTFLANTWGALTYGTVTNTQS